MNAPARSLPVEAGISNTENAEARGRAGRSVCPARNTTMKRMRVCWKGTPPPQNGDLHSGSAARRKFCGIRLAAGGLNHASHIVSASVSHPLSLNACRLRAEILSKRRLC